MRLDIYLDSTTWKVFSFLHSAERTSPFLTPYIPKAFHIVDVSFFTEGSKFHDYIPDAFGTAFPVECSVFELQRKLNIKP